MTVTTVQLRTVEIDVAQPFTYQSSPVPCPSGDLVPAYSSAVYHYGDSERDAA